MMMCWRTHLCLLVAFVQIFSIAASTDANDFVALKSLKGTWNNEPPNWANNDPCASDWDGIKCSNDRVVSITLASISLSGRLSSNITKLSELQILDLSSNKRLIGPLPESIGDLKNLSSLNLAGCGFSGQIPHSIGSLQKLVYLFLNSNNFYGKIPPSIGNLSNLYLLDLSDNKLSGSIPVSKGSTPGLDMLVNTWYFHLGKNQLSGEIPYQLFSSNMKLIHLLLENNQLTGSIPSSIGLVQTLEIIRLDRNFLSEPLPENLNNLTQVQDLYLANNKLTGPLPNLNGMNWLQYVDFSNNSFDATDIRQWFSSLPNLTSLIMENTGIQGQLPVSLFSLSALQTILMKKNRINGTLNISSSNSNQLKLIDLQDNLIEDLTPRAGYSFQIILVGNPICDGEIKANYCAIPQQSNLSYSMPEENCTFLSCSAFKVLSPTCRCAYPYSGNLYFRAPSIFSLGNESLFKSLERTLMDSFTSDSQPVDSVHVSDPTQNIDGYLVLNLQIFPSGKDYFNRKEISGIRFMLSNQTFKPQKGFGPFYFKANEYLPFVESTAESHKSSRTTMIIGEAVGGSVLVLLLLITGLCAFHQNKRAETPSRRMDPFGLISCFCLICYLWPKLKRKESREAPQNLLLLDLNSNRPMHEKCISVGNSHGEEINNHYELPIFSFSSIVASTNNFSITNKLGQGGYGPVYKGELLNKQLIAVKRLSRRSGQGPEEFKNEIELTAKLQHRNLVGIFGCCIENDEKILVYEYMPKKSLDLYLFDPTKRELLDWKKRLHIIDGIARGLLYLHHDSRLRVVHRDLKASNILLDANMNAKISDFGLARIFGGNDSEANTKRIVGTYGYMSPEYAMQGLFSLKSDVFAFGVLILEIISGKKNTGFYGSEYLSLLGYAWNLWKNERVLELIDPVLEIPASSSSMALRCIQIGLLCVQENPAIRPLMFDVVTMLNNKEPEMASPQHPAFTTGQTWAEASPTQREVEICSPNGLTDSILEAR